MVEITPAAAGVKLVHIISREKIKAVGSYGTATPDRLQVFNVTLKQNGRQYEQTCMVSTDLLAVPLGGLAALAGLMALPEHWLTTHDADRNGIFGTMINAAVCSLAMYGGLTWSGNMLRVKAQFALRRFASPATNEDRDS